MVSPKTAILAFPEMQPFLVSMEGLVDLEANLAPAQRVLQLCQEVPLSRIERRTSPIDSSQASRQAHASARLAGIGLHSLGVASGSPGTHSFAMGHLSAEERSTIVKDLWAGASFSQEYCSQQHFGIGQSIKRLDTQARRIAAAALCAKENVWTTTENINVFNIQNEQARIYIANICAQYDGLATFKNLPNFDIQDEEALIGIKQECAKEIRKRYGEDLLANDPLSADDICVIALDIWGRISQADLIARFDTQVKRVAAAEFHAKASRWVFSVTFIINTLGITNEQVRIHLANICAQLDGRSTDQYIVWFGIKDEQALISIKHTCEEQIKKEDAEKAKSPLSSEDIYMIEQECGGMVHKVIESIKRFNTQARRIAAAELCAKSDPWGMAENFKIFDIQEERARIRIANICAQHGASSTIRNIQNFDIQDEQALISIKQKCAQRIAYTTQFKCNHRVFREWGFL